MNSIEIPIRIDRPLTAKINYRDWVLALPNWPKFVEYCFHHMYWKEIDPMFPLMNMLYKQESLSEEIRLWRTLLFFTYYNLGSAELVWRKWPEPIYMESADSFPVFSERRGFRSNSARITSFIHESLKFFYETYGSMSAFMQFVMSHASKQQRWEIITQIIPKIKFNGVWAGYKWAELMKHVHGYDIEADNIRGLESPKGTAGPYAGLRWLTGLEPEQCLDEDLQFTIYQLCLEQGVPWDGIDRFETALCGYEAICNGRYYIGKDIDGQMEIIPKDSCFWPLRQQVFDPKFLGELNGWFGVRKQFKSWFKNTSNIVWWN